MKTLVVNKELNYSLHNNENFKKELEPEINDIVKKLSELFIDYFKFIIENIKLKKTNFSRFIITRGLDTIINVFNNILLYTKNLDVTYFHCQKAFYFYVEFVGQISEDEKMFLQLSSRDASTYVYKKTIFEINNEIRKSNEDISDYTRLKLDIINSYVDLYKTILLKLINHDFLNNEKLIIIQNIYNKLNNLTNKSKIKLLNELIEKFYYQIDDDKYFLDSCELLVKKFCKNQDLLYDNCLNKFLDEEFKDKLQDNYDKFINWFMN
jgi:hypothetical protein